MVITKYKIGEKVMWTNPQKSNVSDDRLYEVGTVISIGGQWVFPRVRMNISRESYEFTDDSVTLAEGPW